MGSSLSGDAELAAFFDALPERAQQQLRSALTGIGADVAAEQQRLAPVLRQARKGRTPGALRAAISFKVLADQLRVVVGLLSGKPFYGRIVEYGRVAQTVRATRGRKARRLRAAMIGKSYSLRVAPLPPRPFINIPDGTLAEIADARLADFWANVAGTA